MSKWTTCLTVAAALSIAVPARAEDDKLERAKASFKAGATAYAAGEYLAAIQALDAAYQLTPIPAIAFSLAQAERRQYFVAHEREHLERAIKLFRLYVEQVPTAGRRADALDALAQLEPLAAVPEAPAPRAAVSADAIRRTRLMVTSEAPGALISLDGGHASSSPLIREVQPGRHRVEVVAEGFYPDQREVTAIADELIPEVVTLRERPATVVVASPRAAEIYVDGVFAAHGGERVVLELASGPHRLTVAESGHRVEARTLELERGKTENLRVDLEPTQQRKAAHVLFVTGGGAALAGAVFAALALGAENDAEDFLARQSAGNVTARELDEYDDDLAARERFRVATGVSLASAAGLFITGFFLYQFDRPRAEEVSRPAGAGARRTSRLEAPSLRVAPLVQPSGFGAAIGGSF
jgi:hypothetical protein